VQGEFPPPPTPEFGFGKAGKGGKELGGGGKIVREAALTLAQASRLMDNIMLQMQVRKRFIFISIRNFLEIGILAYVSFSWNLSSHIGYQH
jgi:hypothetical protein